MRLLETKPLARSGVDGQLDRLFGFPLTVLCAPTGYGKTAALRAYFQGGATEAIWLSLADPGGSSAHYFSCLAAQIGKKNPALGGRLGRLGFPADAPQRAHMVGLLHEIVCAAPTVVVVDGYHLADCRPVAALVAAVAAAQIANLHLVLLARELPALPMADLEQRGLCLVIGQETLQLNVPSGTDRPPEEHQNEDPNPVAQTANPDEGITFGAPHLLYGYYTQCGTLRARCESISARFHAPTKGEEGRGAGSGPLALAEYALETGDFGNVLVHAQTAIDQSRVYHQTAIEICASFVLARLSLIQGRFAEGEGLLTQLAQRVGEQDSGVLNTMVTLCLAYINACYGNVDALPLWLRENDLGDDDPMLRDTAFPYLVCLRAVLLTGAFVRLEVLCREFEGKFIRHHNCLGLIHNGICAAIAKERLYGIEAGCGELERTLLLAAPDDIVMPFGENAMGILPMLRKMRCSKWVPHDFLARVTGCCELYNSRVVGLLPSTVTLTEREREILRMLAKGIKHEEAAAALGISVPTIRYHVKNAYQKLEVNNKVSAIQKARSLNFI